MYKGLSRAQLSFDYLHTNSTTHEFLFGALAELLDNARDAYATKINIHSVSDASLRGGYMLCFLDDGQGMSSEEASDIITFGKSTKKSLDSHMIGKYGNGLKSGSMRIGNDLMLFTKKESSLTCVFLSRTFHEREQLEEIIVPMPSFDTNTKRPLARTSREREKHVQEMELILKYSPFKTDAQFMKEFDKIEGSSGTLVIVYNLKLLDSGEPELDVKTDPYDILLSLHEDDGNDELMPERKSFRSYASILYVEPRMRVYIQGKKVRTKRIVSNLSRPRSYRYTSARFKARSEKETKKAEEDARNAEHRAREAESKAKELEIKLGTMPDKEQRIELRRAQTHALELRKEAQLRKAISERKKKTLKEPKQLTFVFGINLENRSRDGVFVYNCSRLIKMYQKIGPQLDRGVLCNGIVGVVDAPYLVLEPTHNKQDFADAKEYRHLQQAMGEHMLQYWRDIDIAQQGVSKFWENFGYISPNWHALPSSDPKYIRKRTAEVQITLQCDLCLKWRIIPYSSNNINKIFPDDWVCSMNPDPSHNRCSAAEEKPNLPEGYLKKVAKSKEQKERDLEEEIRRKQSQLEKMQKHAISAWKRADSLSSDSSSEDRSEIEAKNHIKKRSISNHSSGSESSQLKKVALASKNTFQKANHQQALHPSPSLVNRPGQKSFSASLSSSSNTRMKTISQAVSNKQPEKSIKQTPSSFSSPNKRPSEPAKDKRPSDRIKERKTPKIKKQNGRNNHNSDDCNFDNSRDSDDVDEDDYNARISEKRRKVMAPSVTYEKRSLKPKDKPKERKTSTSISIDDEDEDDGDDNDDYVANSVSHPSEKDAVVEEAEHGSGCNATVGSQMTPGKRIKALVQKVWIPGEVIEESRSKERCRIRFDESFHGITDMWFEKDSHDIQLTSPRVPETPVRSPSRDGETFHTDVMLNINEGEIESLIDHGLKIQPRPDQSAEAPTSSTATVTAVNSINNGDSGAGGINIQAYEDIANNFRTCLRYFLPPQWHMDKETVSSLGIPELSSFSLDDFFDQYEKGLRKLVSSFQQEAQVRQAEAEVSGSKLSTVRRMIAKLLKTINEDFEIDPECDSDEVDELLALCLRQALEHARGSNDFTS